MLLATDFAITQFVAFGQDEVEFDKKITVEAGLVGSNGEVDVDKDSTTLGLVGGGKMKVNKSTVVNGDVLFNGKVDLKRHVVVHGDVDASHKIKIDKHSTINGDVTSAKDVDLHSRVIVTGTVTEFGTPETFGSVTFPTITTLDDNISTGSGVTTTLLPGFYGKLDLKKENTLVLSSGEYYFREIKADKDLQLNLDVSGGEIAIFVKGEVEFGKNLDVSIIGGGADDVYLETHDRFRLKEQGEWLGTIFAPFDEILLDKHTTLVGAAYSGSKVDVDEHASLQLVAADRLSQSAVTDFVVFGDDRVNIDEHVTIVSGTVGSNAKLDVDHGVVTAGLAGDKSLDIDRWVIVNGNIVFNGKVEIEDRVVVHGNVDAGGKIKVDKKATINGDLTSARSIDLKSHVTVTGTVVEFGSPTAFVAPELPSISVLPSDVDATGSSTVLAPGHYDQLKLRKNHELHLSSGQYFFSEIKVDRNVDLILDVTAGEIAIFVSGKATFGKNLEVSLTGGGAESVYLETHGKFELKKDSEWFGTIFAPFNKIDLDKNTVLVGAAYSGTTVKVDDESTLQLVPATRLLSGSDTDPPVIVAALASDTGANSSDHVTSNPAVSGMVTDASSVTEFLVRIPELSAGPFDVTTQLGAGGAFLLNRALLETQLGTTLADDSYTIRLQAKDQFNNVSAFLDVPLVLDTVITTPEITSISGDTGTSSSDEITNDTTLTVSGSSDPNSTVELFRGGTSIGSATANGSGNWSKADATTLAAGSYVYTATATDVAGNNSNTSNGFNVTVDLSAPTPLIGSTANDPTNAATIPVTINFGEAVADFVLGDISVTNGTAGNFQSASGGLFTIDVTPTADGAVQVDIAALVAQDLAGNDNATALQFSIVSDRTQPTPLIGSAAGDPTNVAAIPITINFGETVSGFVLGDISVTNGTAGDFQSAGGGLFTIDVTPTTDGAVQVNIAATVAQDLAGNNNNAATTFSITSDRTAPAAPVVNSITDDTGSNSSDGITNDTTLTVAGSAEANSEVELFRDGTSIGTVTANAAGDWSKADPTTLAAAGYVYTATATDAAGNTSVSAHFNRH